MSFGERQEGGFEKNKVKLDSLNEKEYCLLLIGLWIF
jgi:hypothetical protein